MSGFEWTIILTVWVAYALYVAHVMLKEDE